MVSGELEWPAHFSHELAQVLQGMLTIDPKQRTTIQAIKQSKFWMDGLPAVPSPMVEILEQEEPLSEPMEQDDAVEVGLPTASELIASHSEDDVVLITPSARNASTAEMDMDMGIPEIHYRCPSVMYTAEVCYVC